MEDIQLPELATIVRLLLSAVVIYAAVILYTRIFGLRSFSKMSSFDFAITVAIGSIIASTVVSPSPMIAEGIIGLFFLYMLQFILAWLREKLKGVDKAVDNSPTLLMRNGKMIEHNLTKTYVRHEDIYAKLRGANVTKLADVRLMILETTGDISVITSGEPGEALEDWVLAGVSV